MVTSGDCDPAYPALNYIADRFELNIEQRYWISFLYGCTYCVPTVYYIYNEFPDYENVDVKRLQNWWDNNKQRLFFQTDRVKIKNFNQFVDVFKSYKELMGTNQHAAISRFKTYDELYKFLGRIYQFGRFSLFNYIETLYELTPTKFEATELNLKEAESCRNGLCYVFDKTHYVTMHHKESERPINYEELQRDLKTLYDELKKSFPQIPVTYYKIETALCAYKKLFWKTRYLYYYIDRLQEEIQTMQKNVPEGVDWSVLWDFRDEYFANDLLGEHHGWHGIRKERMNIFANYGAFVPYFDNTHIDKTYTHKVYFEEGGCYGV